MGPPCPCKSCKIARHYANHEADLPTSKAARLDQINIPRATCPYCGFSVARGQCHLCPSTGSWTYYPWKTPRVNQYGKRPPQGPPLP